MQMLHNKGEFLVVVDINLPPDMARAVIHPVILHPVFKHLSQRSQILLHMEKPERLLVGIDAASVGCEADAAPHIAGVCIEEQFHALHRRHQLFAQMLCHDPGYFRLGAALRRFLRGFGRLAGNHLNGTGQGLPRFHNDFQRQGVDHIFLAVQNLAFRNLFMGNTGIITDAVFAATAAPPYRKTVLLVL